MRGVVVGAGSEARRRQLGPTSWTVFEELLLRPTGSGDECVARLSVREVAGSLGLANDTAGHAVRWLRDLGRVSAMQHRANGAG